MRRERDRRGDGGTPFEQVEVRMVSWRLRTRMKPRATARERAGERERVMREVASVEQPGCE